MCLFHSHEYKEVERKHTYFAWDYGYTVGAKNNPQTIILLQCSKCGKYKKEYLDGHWGKINQEIKTDE